MDDREQQRKVYEQIKVASRLSSGLSNYRMDQNKRFEGPSRNSSGSPSKSPFT